jgi:hypothetical protein
MNFELEITEGDSGTLKRSFTFPVSGLTVGELREYLKGARDSDVIYANLGELSISHEVGVYELLNGAIKYAPDSGLLRITEGLEIEKKILNPVPNRIFKSLVERVNQPVCREELVGCLSTTYNGSDLRTVDNHIRVIRDTLGPYSESVITVYGVGYAFEDL